MRRWAQHLFCGIALPALLLELTNDSRGVRISAPPAAQIDTVINSLPNARFLLRRCGIRVYARDTRRRAELYVHFKSGRTKQIASSLDSLSLQSFATASRIVTAVIGE